MKKFRRVLAILCLIAISLAVGFGVDLLWDKAEELTHPQAYREIVAKYAGQYNIPEYVILAVIKTESDFDPRATSSAGAMGLMQMMPSTFEWLTGDEHLGEHLPVQRLYDPEVSIRYGTYYLKYLYRQFNYRRNTAIAAYNAGEGNVSKWLKSSEYSDGAGNLTHIPFDETRSYVSKVNSAIDLYQKLYYQPNEGVRT